MNFFLFFSFFLFNKINFSSYINRVVIIIRNHLQHLCFFHYFFSFSFAPPAHLFSLHIINMSNFFQVRLFLRIFLHLFFRPPKVKKKSLRLFLTQNIPVTPHNVSPGQQCIQSFCTSLSPHPLRHGRQTARRAVR